MLNRPLGMNPVDNPLIDSPFIQQYDIGLGNFPSSDLWILLDGQDFNALDGQHLAFLG